MGNESIVEWTDRPTPGVESKRKADIAAGVENLDEALKKDPRLCWVWNTDQGLYLAVVTRVQKLHNWRQYIDTEGRGWGNARLAKREGIEKYLGE